VTLSGPLEHASFPRAAVQVFGMTAVSALSLPQGRAEGQ
jgi:hypothetical protein